MWGLCHDIALPGPESKNRSVRPLDWIWAYFRILPNFFGSAKKREGGGQILSSECAMLGMDGYHIISYQKGSWFKWQDIPKLISRPSTAVIYGWMNLYFIF